MSGCFEFRDNLERVLCGLPDPEKLIPLSWDAHLLGCEDCRELLQAEQALELVLASLPQPKLPPDLNSRVIERLRREREGAHNHAFDLDAVLEGAPDPVMPANLSERILRGVESARNEQLASSQKADDQLDALLNLVSSPKAPTNLSASVLDAVDAERWAGAENGNRVSSFQLLKGARVWVPVAAAVLVAILWFTNSIGELKDIPRVEELNHTQVASATELNDEMIDAFEVLENWEHLNGDDLDLLLASIDELDELLIETSEWELVETTDAGDSEDSEG
ncbi:MAG: hypothetical protein ACI8TQ_003640 [Planctomycetota bacterium]|jgi:hypothetical protein